MVILIALCGIGGIYWHSFGEPHASPKAQAATVAAHALRQIREVLSTRALSAKDTYPATLDSLGDRVNLPLEAARAAGYRLVYAAKPGASDAGPRGFILEAMAEKASYANLFIDESGVVRATQENRPATANDPSL